MSSNITLLNVTPEELADIVATIVKDELKKEIPNKPISDFIPTKTAVDLLGITKPTLHRHCKNGVLNKYNFEGKTFFKLSEIEARMKLQSK